MARETKAERQVREAAERQARLEQEREAYPSKLMAALERLNNQYDMDLKVQNGLFVVRNGRDRYDNEYSLSYSWNSESQQTLESLEWKLDEIEEAQREAHRRLEVKREAQRKAQEVFTEEERELLGLQ